MSDELIRAIHAKDEEKVRSLLSSPNINIEYLYTPKSKNIDLVVTPLQFAASVGNIAIVNMLLEKGADPKAVSKFGRSALSIAAFYGHLEVVKILLPISDVLSKDNDKLEAYSNAKRGMNTSIEEKKKRCQEVENYLRTSTFLFALQTNDQKVLEEVQKEEIDYAQIFCDASFFGRTHIVKKMIAMDCVDVNVLHDEMTALHGACLNGHEEIVLALLNHPQIDVNIKSMCSFEKRTEFTALHFTCHHSKILSNPTSVSLDEQSIRVNIAEALLKAGADINAKTSDGLAPIHEAIAYNTLDMVKLLVLHNADLNVITRVSEELVQKYIINPAASDYYDNILSFSTARPEIKEFLENAVYGKNNFGQAEYIGGFFRTNPNYQSNDGKIKNTVDLFESVAKTQLPLQTY